MHNMVGFLHKKYAEKCHFKNGKETKLSLKIQINHSKN